MKCKDCSVYARFCGYSFNIYKEDNKTWAVRRHVTGDASADLALFPGFISLFEAVMFLSGILDELENQCQQKVNNRF